MMKNIYRLMILMATVLSPSISQAQDQSFSQTYEAPLYLSPSFTGLTNGSRIGVNYRNQWPGIGSVYQNYAVSFDHFFDRFSSGLGLTWVCDNQGTGLLTDNEVGLNYAYEFSLNTNLFVRPGLAFKVGQRSVNRSKMVSYTDITADGMFIPGGSSVDFERTRTSRIDAAASVMIYNDNFWVGVAFDHLMKPDVSFTDMRSELGIKSTLYCGYKFTYEDSYRGSEPKTVSVVLNYKNQYSFNQLEVGAFWYYNPIELGISYRGLFFNMAGELSSTDAIIPNLGVNIGPLRIGYSYDLTISELSAFGNGAHEVSLMYRIIPDDVKRRSYKMKPVPCTEPIMGYSYSGSGKGKARVSRRKYFRR